MSEHPGLKIKNFRRRVVDLIDRYGYEQVVEQFHDVIEAFGSGGNRSRAAMRKIRRQSQTTLWDTRDADIGWLLTRAKTKSHPTGPWLVSIAFF